MRLPGARLLHEWDLAQRPMALDDLLRSCRESELTGLVELQFEDCTGMALYHLGALVRVFVRRGVLGWQGQDALERLRPRVSGQHGRIAVRELPLDAAHLLRGATHRRRLPAPLATPFDLHALLHALQKSAHTGLVEVHGAQGDGLVLFVRGRIANAYWDASDGASCQDAPARERMAQALAVSPAQVFLSDFSADAAKRRHEPAAPLASRLHRRAPGAPGRHEMAVGSARQRMLAELLREAPGLWHVSVCDALTAAVLAQQGRGSECAHVAEMVARLPALVRQLDQAVGPGDDLEHVELHTARLTAMAVSVPEAREVLVAVADKALPPVSLRAALERHARDYGPEAALAHQAGAAERRAMPRALRALHWAVRAPPRSRPAAARAPARLQSVRRTGGPPRPGGLRWTSRPWGCWPPDWCCSWRAPTSWCAAPRSWRRRRASRRS